MYKIILLLLTLFTTNSFATEIVDLYQSQQPVANQEEKERTRVSPNILSQVLLKVVGDRALLNATDLTPILAQVSTLIQQSQYRRLNVFADDLTEPDQLALSLKFNESSVNQALTTLRLPIWSKSRPDVMIWLAIDDGDTRRILSADDAEATYTKALHQAALQRGLPILLPIMDLQDQSQIEFADVWGEFTDPIQKATERYAAKIILMGSVSTHRNGGVEVRWQSLINGETLQWQSKGDITTAMQSGIETLTDNVARRFTQVVASNSVQEALDVLISNVRDYADYARVIDYLTQLHYVSDVQIGKLEQDKMTVKVLIRGDKSVFNRTLAIEQVIQQELSNTGSDETKFRLLP